MGDHIVDAQWDLAAGAGRIFVGLKFTVHNVTAQDLLWEYAQRRRAVDAGFSEDLETCLRAAGYVPAPHPTAVSAVGASPQSASDTKVPQ
jgi:hypothetical protein